MRFRTHEIATGLDRACKIADRKRIKKHLIKDIIHGAGICGPPGVVTTPEERAWSGLDAFRHVLEDDVKEPKGRFDVILHSILNAQVRAQDG